MSVRMLSAAVEDMIQKAAVRHAVMVEAVLCQLVAQGFTAADLTYKHLPDLDKELLVCKEVCVMVIQRIYEGAAIRTTYRIYPDGRPGGWPELEFQC